jgi:hypothetical protein
VSVAADLNVVIFNSFGRHHPIALIHTPGEPFKLAPARVLFVLHEKGFYRPPDWHLQLIEDPRLVQRDDGDPMGGAGAVAAGARERCADGVRARGARSGTSRSGTSRSGT